MIRVEGLSKQYRLGASQARYGSLRESLSRIARSPLSALGVGRSKAELFWALSELTFKVEAGEVVGVIGRNGAGKSTLLKILSRITQPSRGRVSLYGRIGSLLEVGTGFHPELTGRENVFLNGAILGMRRSEITKKFDEIVAFAEVERFIDTQVKHYSSGMYMRLAFAVAAHLEPEILVVDEVLAVGDAAFQRKCLNKMEDVGHQGRTVMFVSHNMPAVTRLCPRTILLEEGRILRDGPSHEVVSAYLTSGLGTVAARKWPEARSAPGNDIAKLRSVRVCSETGDTLEAADIRRPIGIEMEYEVLEAGHVLVPNLHFFNEEGVCVFIAADVGPDWRRRPRPSGTYVSTAWLPGNLLSEGTIIVGVALSTHASVIVHFFERDAVAFHVVDPFEGDSARGDYSGGYPGVVRPLLDWTTSVTDSEGESLVFTVEDRTS